LLLVAAGAVAVAVLLTRRVTRSLEQLADAAEAVARGDLERRVEPTTHDEVGRLAAAFNAMTESLRRTLGELSERQAVAAVGEFAAALAHEVRNPLSAIRLNLQHLQEQLANEPGPQNRIGQVLRDVERLDRTVAGALRVARTGRMSVSLIAIHAPLAAAARAAAPEFATRQVVMEAIDAPEAAVEVRGNSAALEQLFLNLLLNAAQASPPGSRVTTELHLEGESVVIGIADSGPGFPPEVAARAFEAFFTTRPEGTGLGLTVARRIAAAHGGSLAITSSATGGAVVIVTLPLAHTVALV
jgi:two-component system sensor histidine kinase AtoS